MLAAAVVFVGVGVAGWRSLPPHIRGLDLLDAAAVLLVLAPATTILNGLEFAATARLVGQRPSVPESVRIAVLGIAANLLTLPGAALVRVAAMRRAAELWADARRQGTPTAGRSRIDADVILAAQAEQVEAVVATENVRHLARFALARRWRDIG